MRILLLLILFKLAAGVSFIAPAQESQAQAQAVEKATAKVAPPSSGGPLVFNPLNDQILLDAKAKPRTTLVVGPNDPSITRITALLLEGQHYLQHPLDNTYASKFLDRYLEVLDNLHMHFLQSDVEEFDVYRKTLDELTERQGDIKPALRMFSRFLERIEQRVDYVDELLKSEKFEFTGNDRYNLDRRKSPRPKDLEEARHIWRQHLRYEILQEKLAKEKPAEIADKITRRYARMLKTLKEYDNDDILELYLSALAHAYDPHSDYMGKSALESFNISMKLALFGIGALLRSEDDYCKIVSLVPEGPAEKSKMLKPNDRIIAVAQGSGEPVDVVGMKLNKVVEMIRGEKGTKVTLTTIPADAPDPSVRRTVNLVRDEIKLEDQEAKAKIIDLPPANGKSLRLGVIDLPSFYADLLSGKKSDSEQKKSTTRDVKVLLHKLKQEKVDGVILDLRRNGGGSLEEAINLTGLFIKEGPVVQVAGPDGPPIIDKDTDPTVFYDGPLIVLTSRFSASASEILAGALQDYGRALIVGDSSTHGKGTVQSLIELKNIGSFRKNPPSAQDPGALKVTIRKFYRASGSSTQKIGVTPDIVLPSPNNYAEVGEAALDNALPHDTIPSAKYEKLNRIQPVLPELQRLSSLRVESDKDFEYLKEDIEQMKKALADKTVSLNEAQRLKEKEEIEVRRKTRQQELKSRPASTEKTFSLTLKLAELPGLPPAESTTNAVAKAENADHPTKDSDDEDETTEPRAIPVDVTMKEAKRILVNLIALSSGDNAVAANAKKLGDDKLGGVLTGPGRN